MKKRELYVLLSVVLLAGLLAACNKKPASGADAPLTVKNLIVGVFPGSNVLSFYDKDNNLTGLEIELIREIDKRLPQYTVEFVPIEYRSMFASLKSNRVDIVTSNLRRNGEREDYLHTYRGLNYWVNKIVVLSDNTTINSIDDLEGKRLCTPQGTLSAIFMENYIKETGKKINQVYAPNSALELVSGRVDALITADYLVDVNLNPNYKDQGIQFKTVGGPIDTNEGVETDRNVYYFFSDGNEEARNAFSDTIYEIRKDGTLSKLHLQFFGFDRTGLIDVAEEEKQMKELGRL